MTENTAQADGAFSHLTADLGTRHTAMMNISEFVTDEADDGLDKLRKRYILDEKWRAAWLAKSNKFDYGRTRSVQEHIDKRANQADFRVWVLYHKIKLLWTLRRSV